MIEFKVSFWDAPDGQPNYPVYGVAHIDLTESELRAVGLYLGSQAEGIARSILAATNSLPQKSTPAAAPPADAAPGQTQKAPAPAP
jgi:hypothetical protein